MSKQDLPSFETTHEVRDLCLCLYVQRAARALARQYDEALRPAGLTNGQFSLLMSLNRPAPPTMGDVASLLAMDRTTLTAALKPLERRGLAKVGVGDADRRSRVLTLTPAGRKALAKALPFWREAQQQTEANLAPSSTNRLRKALQALS